MEQNRFLNEGDDFMKSNSKKKRTYGKKAYRKRKRSKKSIKVAESNIKKSKEKKSITHTKSEIDKSKVKFLGFLALLFIISYLYFSKYYFI